MTENTPAGDSQVLHAPSVTNELDMARATLRTATAGLPALRAAVVRDYDAGPAAQHASMWAHADYVISTIEPALLGLQALDLLAGLPLTKCRTGLGR
jgi:hypothetical protein